MVFDLITMAPEACWYTEFDTDVYLANMPKCYQHAAGMSEIDRVATAAVVDQFSLTKPDCAYAQGENESFEL